MISYNIRWCRKTKTNNQIKPTVRHQHSKLATRFNQAYAMETISDQIRSKRFREQYNNTIIEFCSVSTPFNYFASFVVCENSKTVMAWLSNYIYIGTSKTARKTLFCFSMQSSLSYNKNTRYLISINQMGFH